MKKTLKTIMTAAAFAAAMGASAASDVNVAGKAPTIPASEVEFDPSAEKTSVLYGPPEVLFERGDLITDGEINVFDLIVMKRGLIDESSLSMVQSRLVDVNQDGKFSIADVVALSNYINGKNSYYVTYNDEDFEEIVTTQQITSIEKITTTLGTTVMPLYGPPEVLSSYYSKTTTTSADTAAFDDELPMETKAAETADK